MLARGAYFFGRVKAEGLTESRYGSGRNRFSATTDQSQYPLRRRQAHLGGCCVRACAEVQGTFALTIYGRSFNQWLQQATTSCSSHRNASVAARAYRLVPAMRRSKRACSKEPSSCHAEPAQSRRSVIMTCPYRGMGCGIKAETATAALLA
jgi:formate dehydrogenase major subunit